MTNGLASGTLPTGVVVRNPDESAAAHRSGLNAGETPMNPGKRTVIVGLALGWLALGPLRPAAAETPLPSYLADRGTGIHTSLFGSYVKKGELLFYPFYEYTRTSAYEYKPSELGFAGNTDYLGKLVEHEALVFFAYGFSDRLMMEFESALHARAKLEKDPSDLSAVPAILKESGLGDTEGQIRYRFREENEDLAEVIGYFEVVLPLQRSRVLIGTQAWELAAGVNVTKGFPFGTLMAKAGLAWDADGHDLEFGEYGVEYVKRASRAWRLVAALEGESDELSAIGEAQYTLTRHAVLKLNTGIGLTQKAPDLAPEVGLMFSF